ncbi:AAA family ATPase [Pelagicoccus enzymogenes]|uniref:AAA family ATPase n=1 Tax=Pelagicoccus enzymogenes TaxID=2773457 RepID=UPI00280D6719|nr:AAA family ATPase [Pelagicoccus enzymogenes]MDQ8199679.1 AAA family ATPase [Pelagicoccus enzymogenes]
MNEKLDFSEIQLEGWRQFESVSIDLSKQTTVLTGSNGCGKTTILNVLSNHFGWSINFVSTPYISKRSRKKIFSDFWRLFEKEEPQRNQMKNVGRITYSNGSVCDLSVQVGNTNNPQYQLQYNKRQNVTGLNIPSHRPAISYHQVSQIPTNPRTNQEHYQEFQQLLLQTYGATRSNNPGMVLKQSLISLGVFGFGNQAVQANDEYRDLFERFQQILSIMLPSNLGFRRIEIRMPDVVLVTDSGDFSLDAMSGGVSSVFGIAWQIHMYGAAKQGCTVIIDEPENHLHPSMQRTLLPNLERAFPNNQFIIATHSPFIVSSNSNARVYGLKYDSNRKIRSEQLENADLAASPDKVLREILDVPTTIPIWVEDEIRKVFQKYQPLPDNQQKAESIFNELKKLGINEGISNFPNEVD